MHPHILHNVTSFGYSVILLGQKKNIQFISLHQLLNNVFANIQWVVETGWIWEAASRREESWQVPNRWGAGRNSKEKDVKPFLHSDRGIMPFPWSLFRSPSFSTSPVKWINGGCCSCGLGWWWRAQSAAVGASVLPYIVRIITVNALPCRERCLQSYNHNDIKYRSSRKHLLLRRRQGQHLNNLIIGSSEITLALSSNLVFATQKEVGANLK